jgi:UDP-glucose 4-epimerase
MIVLIGGNGFIGRHVTISAGKRGIPVTVVDRVLDHEFLAANAPGANVVSALQFNGKEGDDLIGRAESIVYLVSSSVQPTYVNEPWLEVSENVLPSFQAFWRISGINPHAKIIFLSSGGTVYGMQNCQAISETASPAPISAYGLAKVMVESSLGFFGNSRGQRYAILRVSNPVGCWHSNPQQGLVNAVLRAIEHGKPLPVYGDGSHVRDYLDADDLADAIIRVSLDRKHANDVWNVGSGRGHSILEIIDIIADLLGRSPEIDFLEERPFDVRRVVLDIAKFRRDFGWVATTPIKESIEKVINADRSGTWQR